MRLKKIFAVSALAAICTAAAVSRAEDVPLNRMSSAQISDVHRRIADERDRLIDQALNVVDQQMGLATPDIDMLRSAWSIVVNYRPPEAAGRLIKYIDHVSRSPSTRGWERYDDMLILSALGMPAVDAVRTELSQDASPKRLALYCHLLVMVMGVNPAKAKVQDWYDRLDERNKTNSRDGKNLQFLIEHLKSIENPDLLDPLLNESLQN